MSIIGWLVIGGIAGMITSMIISPDNASMRLFRDVILGIVGGFIGGSLFTLIDGQGIAEFNIWSLLVAIIGAVILLAIYEVIFDKDETAEQ